MRPVVLKMFRAGRARDELHRRILREARLASAIDHPNVCTIYEVAESDGLPVIVMQYVPGRTLARLVADGALGLKLALSIGVQIGEGLAEAHRLGILHGDVKPANAIVTDTGLVKLLDFGTARRLRPDPATQGRRAARPVAATMAYMAPEQFVTGETSEASDQFSFGLVLYTLCTGRHPFLDAPGLAGQLPRAIQFLDPPRPSALRPEIGEELDGLLMTALAKQPGERFASVAELRDALKTAMAALDLAPAWSPPVAPLAEPEPPRGLLSALTERFLGAPDGATAPSIAVVPFVDLRPRKATAFYGVALGDAIATRLARTPSLVVRSASTLAALPGPVPSPLEAGRRLHADHVLSGNFHRSEDGFELHWQLEDVASGTLRAGATIEVDSFDLVAVQNEIGDQVFAALHGVGRLEAATPPPTVHDEDGGIAEAYLQARALLSNFLLRSSQRTDLDAALEAFAEVLLRDPGFASAHSGRGVAFLQAVHRGLGGTGLLMEAQRSFDRALAIDPALVEANLYRVETLLVRGEKSSARHGIRHLLRVAGNDFDVRVVASTVLQRDGLYEEALRELGVALRLDPARATIVYGGRARIHGNQGHLELARHELDKGLALEPSHALLRTSLGYLFLRLGHLTAAIDTLEGVLADVPELTLAYPTLAMGYVAAGERARAAALIRDPLIAAAEADCEIAYRLASYFAAAGEVSEALHWLRRAIYLGNENYPWFARNPAWNPVRGNADFEHILAALGRSHRLNLKQWRALLAEDAAA